MTRKLRVLMLMENGSYPHDGRPLREARALLEAGHSVSVICPRAPGQSAVEDVDRVSVRRYRLARARRGPLGYVWEYGYSLAATFVLALCLHRRRPFDVLHAHNPPDTFVLVALFFKLLGKRFVFDHHDLTPEMFAARFGRPPSGALARVMLMFERLSLRTADAVISTNSSYRDMAISRAGLDPSRVTVVRNGPELERFVGCSLPRPRAPGRPLTVGFLGSMSRADGVDRLLHALAHLAHDQGRTDFVCSIAGDGEAVPSLRQLVRELALQAHVSFLGRLPPDSVAGFLDTIDIGAEPAPSNPYNDRCTMVKVMEYMAAARPIVAFDLPENRFSAGDAALFVPANDERAFARAIAALMDDPGRREELGIRGRRRVENGLDWAAWAPELRGVYERLR